MTRSTSRLLTIRVHHRGHWTVAAYGSLKPLPTERLRRAYLHLSYSMTLSRLLDTTAHQNRSRRESDSHRPYDWRGQDCLVAEDQPDERENREHAGVRVPGPEQRALKLGELGILARKDTEKKCAAVLNGGHGNQQDTCDQFR